MSISLFIALTAERSCVANILSHLVLEFLSISNMLVLPDNFGLVEAGVYRCSKIELDNFPFLETLQLKLLIMLDAEKPPRLLLLFLDANNIELFNLGGLKISNHQPNKEDGDKDKVKKEELIDVINLADMRKSSKTEQWMLIEKNLTQRTFELLLDAKKHNILLIDSTSTLVGILRKIQKWNFNLILNEYRTFSASNKNSYYAETFLELIEIELIPYEIDQLNQRLKEEEQLKEQQQLKVQMKYLKEQQKYLESKRNPSIDGLEEVERTDEDDEDYDDDDSYGESDDDDEMLSASPQIPANLLKLVEERKKSEETTPGTSPRLATLHRKSRHNSMGGGNELFLNARKMGRRRSSTDMKRGHSVNVPASVSPGAFTPGSFASPGTYASANYFANTSSGSTAIPTAGNQSRNRRALMESSPPMFRKMREREVQLHLQQIQLQLLQLQTQSMQSLQDSPISSGSLQLLLLSPLLLQLSKQLELLAEAVEVERIRLRHDYQYYKNLNKYSASYEHVSVVKFKLPAENRLPEWFKRGRDFWEESMRRLNE